MRLLRIFQIQIVGIKEGIEWGEVVEILLVYTSIMGEGVYKPSMLYAKAMVLILHIIMICHIQISK